MLGAASGELAFSPSTSFLALVVDAKGLVLGLAFGEDFGGDWAVVGDVDGELELELFVGSETSTFAEELDAHFVGLSVSFQVTDPSGVLPNVFPFPGFSQSFLESISAPDWSYRIIDSLSLLVSLFSQ